MTDVHCLQFNSALFALKCYILNETTEAVDDLLKERGLLEADLHHRNSKRTALNVNYYIPYLYNSPDLQIQQLSELSAVKEFSTQRSFPKK